MRKTHAVRFTILTGIALALALAAGVLGARWLQRTFDLGDWLRHFILLPAAAVLTEAHRRLRRHTAAEPPRVRVAVLSASMVVAVVVVAAAASRGTFWWRQALHLSATGALGVALLLVVAWCAAVVVSEGRVQDEEPAAEARSR